MNGDLPGAGISLSHCMVVDLFSIGVGEQEWGSGHTQQPSKGNEHHFGRGEWWCLSHVRLGSAFGLC